MKKMTREVKIGGLTIGGANKIAVQTMLSCPANDIKANVEQALRAQEAGCEILRVSTPTMESVALIPAIKQVCSLPLVADIHFDYRIAIAAIEAGADKIRLNPGNIGGEDRVKAVVDACKKYGVPIRIGVNGGSLEKEIEEKHGGPTAEALVESALSHVRLLEKQDFYNTIISLKSSHVPTNVAAYRLLSRQCDYPLHLGVTEAGTFTDAVVKNAMGIGTLLLEGIGDTVRVSITGTIEDEIDAAYSILAAADVRREGPEIISCPTCGRTNIPVEQIATQVKQRLKGCKKNIKVAVMGCVVNGLGEGKEADIGIAGGQDSAVLFVKGKQVKTIKNGQYIDELIEAIEKM